MQDYILEKLDRILSENNIRFIKWDMNRNASEPGWDSAPGDPRELWVRYVQGVYRVWGTLRQRHPQVIWQSCSGGGGRVDLGILRLADQIWVSDNTEPTARLNIQEGYSQVFPASTMEAWVTDMGAEYLPLEFRMHVSMCGALGIGGHLVHWGAERRAEAAQMDRPLQGNPPDHPVRRPVPPALCPAKSIFCLDVCEQGAQRGGAVCLPHPPAADPANGTAAADLPAWAGPQGELRRRRLRAGALWDWAGCARESSWS